MSEKVNGYIERKMDEYFIVEENQVTGKTSISIEAAPADSIEKAIEEVLSFRVDDETPIKDYFNYDYGIEEDTYNQIEYSVKLGCFTYCNGYTLEENFNTVKEMYNSMVKDTGFGLWSVGELQNCVYTAYIEICIIEPLNVNELSESYGCDRYHAWKEG